MRLGIFCCKNRFITIVDNFAFYMFYESTNVTIIYKTKSFLTNLHIHGLWWVKSEEKIIPKCNYEEESNQIYPSFELLPILIDLCEIHFFRFFSLRQKCKCSKCSGSNNLLPPCQDCCQTALCLRNIYIW